MKLLCRLSLTPDSCVSNTQARFERLGINAVLISKFVPGLSLIAPPLAGAIRMSWLRFLAFDAMSSTAWVILAATVGVAFHRQIEQLMPFVMAYRVEAVVALCAILVGYIAYKWWDRARFFSRLRMARIEASDLHRLIASGAAPLIVDVRSATAVALEPRRISGALQIPLNEVKDRLPGLPRDREIVAYCTCPNEVSAAEVAKILLDSGFSECAPCVAGSTPGSLQVTQWLPDLARELHSKAPSRSARQRAPEEVERVNEPDDTEVVPGWQHVPQDVQVFVHRIGDGGCAGDPDRVLAPGDFYSHPARDPVDVHVPTEE